MVSAPARFSVAVVGAGPAGLYAADDLLRCDDLEIDVDVIEALPVPYGLVRYGVAPDHPRIKAVTSILASTLSHPRVRFYGGVQVGEHIAIDELHTRYDAVIHAVGAPDDRRLGLPGEELLGSVSAGQMVAWYNGRPGVAQPAPLRGTHALVVGAGNVALDIARMLTKPVSDLRETDMPAAVLETLAQSEIRDVTVLVRRGPRDTRFSPKELRELNLLEGVTMRVEGVEPAELEPGPQDTDRTVVSNLKLFTGWLAAEKTAPRSITIRFFSSPTELIGQDGALTAVTVSSPSAGPETIRTSLIVRSIGSRVIPLSGVPHDEAAGTARHREGRVVNEDGSVSDKDYVVGWFKRGPSGVLGTNKIDAAETVSSLLSDLRSRPAVAEPRRPLTEVLVRQGVDWVDLAGWLAIDEEEIRRGESDGRARVKITQVQDMLAVARSAARTGE